MTPMEIVVESLERAAEIAGDITPRVYERYFARCPDSAALMKLTDQHMRGRMIAEVLRLVMSGDVEVDRSYLRFETRTHETYGVLPAMYRHLFEALRETVREALGAGWNASYERAWTERLDALLTEIDSAVRSASG